jgi:hypothetical protein
MLRHGTSARVASFIFNIHGSSDENAGFGGMFGWFSKHHDDVYG